MQLAIMQVAEERLTNLLSAGLKARISGFKVSATPGPTLTRNGEQPSGAIVYQGDPGQIQYSKISQNELTFVVYLDHDIGQFFVGNLMIFLEGETKTSAPIPFLWGSLAQQTDKNPSNFAKYQVGNRMLLHCTLWFPYIINAIDLTPHKEFVAHFVNWQNENVIPSVDTAEYDQLILEKHSLYNATTLAMKDTVRDFWWAMAFNQYINDPTLGNITGGVIGQEYGSPAITYYDGRYYKIDNAGFPLIDGGAGWQPANTAPIDLGTY